MGNSLEEAGGGGSEPSSARAELLLPPRDTTGVVWRPPERLRCGVSCCAEMNCVVVCCGGTCCFVVVGVVGGCVVASKLKSDSDRFAVSSWLAVAVLVGVAFGEI